MVLLKWFWNLIKLLLALVYLIFDELGGFVRWLRKYLRPLDWYFQVIQNLATRLDRGSSSSRSWVRIVVPVATLPFLLLPVSVILPAKVMLLKLIATQPLYAIPAFLLVKLFGAIFIKETWNILRPIGRRNRWIAKGDDQWQCLENWARKTFHDFGERVKKSQAFQAIQRLIRDLRARVRRLWHR